MSEIDICSSSNGMHLSNLADCFSQSICMYKPTELRSGVAMSLAINASCLYMFKNHGILFGDESNPGAAA